MQRDESSYTQTERYLNPDDINVAAGYRIEVFAYGLDTPVNMIFTNEGSLIVAESGEASGNPEVLRLVNGSFEVMAEGFEAPITGVNYLNGVLYVSHRGYITRVSRDGLKQNLITGLPSNGDHYNGKVVFGPDGRKLYFGQGTVTNSAVVGLDNEWLANHPMLCDYTGRYVILNGQNFETRDIANEFSPGERVLTGAFSPYGSPNAPNEVRKEFVKASGSILRANIDGTMLELYAWGFRDPLNIGFDEGGQLYAANMSYDNRGSRPIANAPDEFFTVSQGIWYGWPDYAGGDPVNLPRFTPEGGRTPELLLKNVPNIPPEPQATFPANSNIMGFDFDYSGFGTYGDVYIAEYGSIGLQISPENVSFAGAGHRVSKIDMKTRTVSTFAINQSGFPSYITQGGGLGRPVDVVFGPDGALYVLDMGIEERGERGRLIPNTGVIWRISRIT
jgi:glucose/arabinose dehydrogenase